MYAEEELMFGRDVINGEIKKKNRRGKKREPPSAFALSKLGWKLKMFV